jgi:hypothetical protein
LFFENRAVFLNNVGKYFTTGKLQMTKWRMHFEWWTPKASNIHSEYEIFVEFYTPTMVTWTRVDITLQKPLPDKMQHSKETDIHAPDEIRNRNPSKRAAADPRLNTHGHRNRKNRFS